VLQIFELAVIEYIYTSLAMAKNLNRLSRAHERYRQTIDRQTDE